MFELEGIKMLKVTIELVPNGDEERTLVLGELTISNTGHPTVNAGNYEAVLTEYHWGRTDQDSSRFRTAASIHGLEQDILRPAQLVGAALSLLVPLKRTMHSFPDPYGVVHSREEL
ncbi:hypothetical protein [Cupriavidus sp. USMAHM13]|uniref:hypothetical protein n=1 Tax=Cupriavidus sp. USMAHM13 TaxID=1389192 RepID=UPI0012EA090F|nr:hypothetical protein [Cupriavidus sp. USMAHM13]